MMSLASLNTLKISETQTIPWKGEKEKKSSFTANANTNAKAWMESKGEVEGVDQHQTEQNTSPDWLLQVLYGVRSMHPP